jgi:hypothetical protein
MTPHLDLLRSASRCRRPTTILFGLVAAATLACCDQHTGDSSGTTGTGNGSGTTGAATGSSGTGGATTGGSGSSTGGGSGSSTGGGTSTGGGSSTGTGSSTGGSGTSTGGGSGSTGGTTGGGDAGGVDAGPVDAGVDDAGPLDAGPVVDAGDGGDQDAGPGCADDCGVLTCCDTTCRDLTSDSLNCGTCGTACANLQYCLDSQCVNAPCYDFKACDPGLWCCGGACCKATDACCTSNGGFQCVASSVGGCP